MDELVRGWNVRWKGAPTGVRVVTWYRHTGNFILELEHGGLPEAIQALRLVEPNKRFAVFEIDAFKDWVAVVRNASTQVPAREKDLRWTPGMVMDSEIGGPTPEPVRSGRMRFGPEARARLMMVWKPDRLLPGRDRLDPDPKARGGGWGSVARAMGPSRWTARSLRTVEGLCAVWSTNMLASRPADSSFAAATSLAPTVQKREGDTLPHYALIDARRKAESLAKQICARAGLPVVQTFHDACVAIERAGLLNPKGLVYLHALRRLGNLAAHPEIGLDFSPSDSEVAAQLLRNLVQEAESH